MRVLVVPKWYPWPDRPVFGIFCREQSRALARRHDVVVLASDAVRSPGFAAFELADAVEDGLRTIRVRYRRPLLRPAAMALQIAGMLAACLRLRREGWRPDVVHAHVYSAGIPALILARLSGAPMVVTEHYTGFERGLITGYDRFAARVAFRGADLVAPVSANLAREVRAVEPRARVRVVENVVDGEVFRPGARARSDGGARLLTVAALAPKKGHADLLDAVAQVRDHGPVSLDLVGDGELRGELRERARRLGLAETVRFHGELPKERVAELMREADLFVLPSLFENLPCVLIEAMASGLPSVATAVGGVPDLLDAGGGILCPPRDPRALAAAISEALERRDAFDSAALAEAARRRFGYEAFERTWTEIYDELLGGRSTLRRMPAPQALRRLAPDRIRDDPRLRALALGAGLIPPRPMHSAAEASALARLAAGAGRVVELGVYEGSSAVVLCRALGPGAELHLIDPFIDPKGSSLRAGWRASPTATRLAVGRAARHGGPAVHWHLAFSQEVGRTWRGGPVDLLFVDGDHSAEGCREDWEAWHSHVAPGGAVAFHDARMGRPGGSGHPGPTSVVDELFRTGSTGWTIFEEVDSLVVVRR
jgi:glycosyltransferase involved in cell wall biosynthesis/predicted O-methyltransferase YrrM